MTWEARLTYDRGRRFEDGEGVGERGAVEGLADYLKHREKDWRGERREVVDGGRW